MTMLCAVCLHIREVEQVEQAITVANGHAVCAVHFQRTQQLITPDYGQVALAALNNPVVIHGSGPGQSS